MGPEEGAQKARDIFAVGLVLPAVAGVWQLAMGALAPTKLQWRELHLVSLYYSNIGSMLTNTLFRPAIILEYLALFSLPFVFLALLVFGYEIIHPDDVISERKSARIATTYIINMLFVVNSATIREAF